jgi:hypothetical protein
MDNCVLELRRLQHVVQVHGPVTKRSAADPVRFECDVRLVLQNIRQPTVFWRLYLWQALLLDVCVYGCLLLVMVVL